MIIPPISHIEFNTIPMILHIIAPRTNFTLASGFPLPSFFAQLAMKRPTQDNMIPVDVGKKNST